MPIHDILTTLAALAAVIVMILLVRYGSRLVGLMPSRAAPHGVLSLEASLALDPKRRLSLIDCDGHRMLLLTGGPSDVLLGWLPAAAATPADPHPCKGCACRSR